MKLPANPVRIALAVLLCVAFPSFGKDDGKKAAPERKGSGNGKREKQDVIDVPIPVGHDASGIKLPLYGADGKLQMSFAIQMAKRVDERRLQMGVLKLETFDETGRSAMSVEMESSVLDLETRIITSEKKTTVRRADFEITGDSVAFDTKAREGRFFGFTRMLIYNLQ
jgi:hypothetical protein